MVGIWTAARGWPIGSGVPIRNHGGRIGDIAIYGQESNHTTWRLCKMNLAVRGIAGYLPPWFKRNPSLVVAELRDLECRRSPPQSDTLNGGLARM